MRRTTLAVLTGAVLLLAGCGADGTTPLDTGTASADPTASVTPDPEPVGTEPEETPAASEEPAPGRVVPDPCAVLTLSGGATYGGPELGACVAEALRSYGSGRMRVTGEGLSGDVDFTYRPDYEFHVDGRTPTGVVDLTLVDGEMWLDTGDGPVKGDPGSDDPEERLAGVAAELYRVLADPATTVDLVRASDGWTASASATSVELPDGTSVDAFRIVSDGPFRWNEIAIDEYVLLFGDGWVPVGADGTTTVMGMTETITERYWDLGADLTITPPV